MRSLGIDRLRQSVAGLTPWVADRVGCLDAWNQAAMVSVQSSRARQWYRPGVLLIGDAAHVMSPVGGIGINLAIQDAVAASNRLGPRLKAGLAPQISDLAAVQRRSELPTRLIQEIQRHMMVQILRTAAFEAASEDRLTIFQRVVQQLPLFGTTRDRLLAYGCLTPARIKE